MPLKFANSLPIGGAGSGGSASKQPFIIQYSADGRTGWTTTLDTAIHKYWRWSTDGGITFSPDLVNFTPTVDMLGKFGWFNYNNSIPSQQIPGGVWTTIQNDTLGIETNDLYSPSDIERMLDPVTGRVLLDQLQVGDEVYIRHTLNIVSNSNNTAYSLSHFFGSGADSYRLPIGVPTTLDEGAGIPTGVFLIDTHFFIKDENSKLNGMLPQIFVSNDSTLNYTGCYISVNRR